MRSSSILPPFRRRAASSLLLALTVLACGIDGEPGRRPLWDDRYAPDVLVEDAHLSTRPTQDGNRFLAGWWPLTRGGGPALAALDEGARLELVHLTERPRTLALDLVNATFDSQGHVEVRAAGRDLGTLALSDPLEIPLPADLPSGRVLVELLAHGAPLEVREGRVRPASAAGETRWDGADLVQSGPSRVDAVRRVAPGESLVGRFHPPPGARPGQRFRIHVERDGGSSATPFEWSPGRLDRFRGSRGFAIPLGETAGLVRISLEAAGEGPPGRWSGLALTSPPPVSPDPPSASTAGFEPPDLVVLYVMDALRADAVTHLGGLRGTTPVLDRLAREGVTFRTHRSAAPNTLPSTKALLTGEAYVDRGGWKLPADGAATLAELFRRAGYRTGLFSGNAYVGPAYGVDRGFDHVTEISVDEHGAPYNDNAERLHEAALAWLGSLPSGEPAFVYVHVIHPHNPYDPPEPWRSELTRGVASAIDGSTRTLLAVNRRRLAADADDRERLRRLYAAGLAYNDAELGRLLVELGRRAPDRRLFLAVTADHGEELFDHGGVLHGYTLYDEMIRIPLVTWSPGLVVPGEWTRPTGTLDLHATLAELAGSDEGVGDGRSLLPILLGRDPAADRFDEIHLAAAASVKGGIYSVQSPRWKLVWAPRTGLDWGLGGGLGRSRSAEYLFDLREDPRELRNRAGEGGLEVAWLRSRLRAWIAAKTARRSEEDDVDVDEETKRRLEALGYVD